MSYDEHLISMAGGDGDVLDQIQKRADAATPGPWKADGETRGDCVVWGPNGRFLMNQQAEPHWIEYPGEKRSVSFDVDRRDGEFIAHARTDIPALLAMVREQRARLDAIDAQVRDLATRLLNEDITASLDVLEALANGEVRLAAVVAATEES